MDVAGIGFGVVGGKKARALTPRDEMFGGGGFRPVCVEGMKGEI